MNEMYRTTIGVLQEELRERERAVRETKRLINDLSKRAGEPEPYPDAMSEGEVGNIGSMRRDQFYGKPLATAIREYLDMRRAANLGPASVTEIFEGLRKGGFKFEAKNDANAKRSLYISLGKNTATFHRLPGGDDDAAVFGLVSWYPNVRPSSSTRTNGGAVATATGADESTPQQEGGDADAGASE